jgi:hypothetical protein
MDKKSFRPRFLHFPALLVFCLLLIAPLQAQLTAGSEKSPADLLAAFKKAKQMPCGQRDEALRIGKDIILRFLNDRANADLVESLIEQYKIIEEQETRCKSGSAEDSLEGLLEVYKLARKAPCGQRDEALRLGRRMIQNYGADEQIKAIIEPIKKDVSVIEEEEKKCKSEISLDTLLADYKIARKLPCGERTNAIKIGKRIIEFYSDDELNTEVISYVVKDVAAIEENDRICRRNARYNQSYKIKNWRGFFAVSKEIFAEEGDNPLALDVMLTLVSVGYTLTAYGGENFYNGDTISYAKKAIDLIESGVTTQSRWGVFEPFETREKALAWLNYTIGYISYFRLKEGKKAIPYFYKATQYKGEFKYDAFVYQAVAIHYFEKETVTASSLTINDFITRAVNLGQVDETGYAPEETAKNNEIAMLYKQLVNLYNLRYNLEPNENVTSLTDYIQKLINRPLINTAASGTKGKSSMQAGY